jgi:predicted nuclease of predicted toxin-antitoxin system
MRRIRGAIAQTQEPALGAYMNFVADAHLPTGLCALLQAAGHDAIHTSQLPGRNRTLDETLNELSFREQRVVVTKDLDFYYSHLLHGKPWKLLLVRTGNIRTRELKTLFQTHLRAIVTALEKHSLVEIDRQEVRAVV